jgi:hypothetical protein
MACPPPQSYCTAAECEEPSRQGRAYCEHHEKRHQRGQSLTAPKAERLSPKEALLVAAQRWVDTDSEDDAEYQRRERAVLRAALRSAPHVTGESVRQGMAEAQQRGVRLGRPPVVTAEQAKEMVRRLGTAALAARALDVSESAVRRALRRRSKPTISTVPTAGDGQV